MRPEQEIRDRVAMADLNIKVLDSEINDIDQSDYEAGVAYERGIKQALRWILGEEEMP